MTARGDAAGRRGGAGPLRQCVECERVFNLNFTEDAEEWFYGHDCEAT